jgi:hypothetical protein
MISLRSNLRQSSLDDDEIASDRGSTASSISAENLADSAAHRGRDNSIVSVVMPMLSTQRVISEPTVFSSGSAVGSLAQAQPWEQTYLVSASKKPQDSVALYQHRLRVDHSSVRKLHEVIATVEALKQQRATATTDDD